MVDVKKFKDIFISETEDHLQKLNDGLLKLEKKSTDQNILDGLMRSAHTIKGSAATMQYPHMEQLAHLMEDVFEDARKKRTTITSHIIDQLLKSVDGLENCLKKIKEKDEEVDLSSFANSLQQLTGVVTKMSKKKLRVEPAIAEKPEAVEKITSIKVPVERLDNLMNLMEELIVDKMRLERLKEKDPEFGVVVDHVSRLVSDLQFQTMQVRLVPVNHIFARFPRMVRDLAREQKKEVELEIVGGEIELDRTIVDKLGEPLVHLLRNAIDHGIAVGKTGRITLEAKREKGYAVISVENNGKGIDFEEVRQAAVKRGILDSSRAKTFTKEELINLLLQGHLSTKEKVTAVSGRGVGLNVVKTYTESLGGRVLVDTALEKGVRFTLELPITLAIIKALLVGVGEEVYAVPFINIDKSVQITPSQITSMADQDVAIIEEEDIPLAYLHQLFNIPRKKNTKGGELIIIVRRGEDRAGLVVDTLITEEEIIVKPLAPVLRTALGFSGSTILGDGRTVLILDTPGLLKDTKKLLRMNFH